MLSVIRYTQQRQRLVVHGGPSIDSLLLKSTPELGLYFQLQDNLSQLDQLYFMAILLMAKGLHLFDKRWNRHRHSSGRGGEGVGFEQAIAKDGTIYFSNLGRLYKTTDGFETHIELTEKMSLTNLQVIAGTIHFTSTWRASDRSLASYSG